MRLNLWLVFRLHWTQSEPIKHMSIMSFWDMGSCKNLWIYGRHICKRNGLFLVPRSADLTWTFSANDTMWSLRKPLNASFMSDLSDNLSINLQDVCIVRPYSFGHDSCTISPKRCYIIACSSTLHGDFLHWLVRGLFYCHTQSGRIAQGRSYFFKLKPITYISHHESSSRSVLQFKRTFIWPTVNV